MIAAPTFAAHAFGLALREDGGARTLAIRVEEEPSPRLGAAFAGTPIAGEHDADGELAWEIAHDPEVGYLIHGPRYGENLLAADGRSVRCRRGTAGEARWARLLVAQVLPFAALLQGLEVFHASAVVHAGEGIGILAGSGGGKSTLARALGARGDDFLTDDVLALELVEGRLLAHAGPPLASIGKDREDLTAVEPGPPSAPLGALFLLDRRPDGPPSPEFVPAAAPRLLIGSTFNAVHTDPARLERQLDVCATAGSGRVERIRVDLETPAATIAAAVHRRLGEGR